MHLLVEIYTSGSDLVFESGDMIGDTIFLLPMMMMMMMEFRKLIFILLVVYKYRQFFIRGFHLAPTLRHTIFVNIVSSILKTTFTCVSNSLIRIRLSRHASFGRLSFSDDQNRSSYA